MAQRLFVTGGTGFVGSAVVDELLGRGHELTLLARNPRPDAARERVRRVRGDLFSTAALDQGMADCDGVIHLVGIIKELPSQGITFERIHDQGAKNVIAAAQRAGIRRFVHMSAMGARPDTPSRYQRTKFSAEQALRDSGLDWTIFRPSLIHGPRGEFLKMQAGWALGRRPPFLFMPYFGGGLFGRAAPTRVQPVYVNDVARAFADALEKPQTIGQSYDMGGSQTLTWPQMYHLVAQAIAGKKKAVIAIPAWYARALTHILPPALLPFSRDQVHMALQDSVGNMTPFMTDFGWEPRSFEQTLREYAAEVS